MCYKVKYKAENVDGEPVGLVLRCGQPSWFAQDCTGLSTESITSQETPKSETNRDNQLYAIRKVLSER